MKLKQLNDALAKNTQDVTNEVTNKVTKEVKSDTTNKIVINLINMNMSIDNIYKATRIMYR